MNTRNNILKKIRCMERKTSLIEPPKAFSFQNSKDSSLVNQFRHNAQSNGIKIMLADNFEKIPALINTHRSSQFIGEKISIAPALKHLPWSTFENFYFGKNDGSYVIGINYAQAAIAQTGALVFINHQNNPATINFLSKEQFIILQKSDIMESMSDIWEIAYNYSNAIHFVAGLSCTADIGGTLLIGVHGPVKLTCIIVIGI